jgi:hypothetical protein
MIIQEMWIYKCIIKQILEEQGRTFCSFFYNVTHVFININLYILQTPISNNVVPWDRHLASAIDRSTFNLFCAVLYKVWYWNQ